MKLYDVLCSEWFVGKHYVRRIFSEIYEGTTVWKVHLHVLFRSKKVIFRSSFPASNSTIGPPHASSPFSLQTGRANVLSKQLKFQKFQERCVQHDAFQRTTRNIKHRTTSYIGTLKTRDFWSKRAQIESKNHNNVVNIVLYWTFLGLSAPYEVVEWSCAIFVY